MAKKLAKPTNDVSPVVASTVAMGAVIRNKRLKDGLRMDDTASLCDVSDALLSRLENGKVGVGTDNLLKVLSGLGLAMLIVPKSQVNNVVLGLSKTGDGQS